MKRKLSERLDELLMDLPWWVILALWVLYAAAVTGTVLWFARGA